MAKSTKTEQPINPSDKKRTRIPQSSVPLLSLNKALKLPQALYDNFASKPTAPIMLAQAIEISPGSSNWRDITGASAAYGLTTGAYNSDKIAITDLAKRIIAPTVEGGEVNARVEAMLKPDTLKKFFTKYNNAKLPKDTIIENVLTVRPGSSLLGFVRLQRRRDLKAQCLSLSNACSLSAPSKPKQLLLYHLYLL